jgi:hypothetical protein
MEKWTFLILAADDGSPDGLRITLRAGADEGAWPRLQVAADGSEVPVDQRPHDYEAPEWKAQQIFAGNDTQWEVLKDKLRSVAAA